MTRIRAVMNKEFARFFRDRRMVIMIILPAILIYVSYSLMGTALMGMFAPDEEHTPVAYVVNMPDSIRPLALSAGFDARNIYLQEVSAMKYWIAQNGPSSVDIIAVFPPDFDAQVAVFDVQTATTPAPNVEIYYNSTDPNSQAAYRLFSAVLEDYERSLAKKFDINRDIFDADQASSEDVMASVFSSMMPMLLMIFIYSGCIGLAPESIAGEKERGTLATLLVTPLKRSELAIGKILSLAVLSFLSGLVTVVATIMALPRLMGGGVDGMIGTSLYGVTDLLLLALVILSSILLLVTAVSIISAFAKSVKEANTAVMPLMFVVMLVGVSGMFGSGAMDGTSFYLIPLFNSVQSMSGIFSLEYSTVNVAIACLSNFVYACVGGFVLTKMFNSEKVMFSK